MGSGISVQAARHDDDDDDKPKETLVILRLADLELIHLEDIQFHFLLGSKKILIIDKMLNILD